MTIDRFIPSSLVTLFVFLNSFPFIAIFICRCRPLMHNRVLIWLLNYQSVLFVCALQETLNSMHLTQLLSSMKHINAGSIPCSQQGPQEPTLQLTALTQTLLTDGKSVLPISWQQNEYSCNVAFSCQGLKSLAHPNLLPFGKSLLSKLWEKYTFSAVIY